MFEKHIKIFFINDGDKEDLDIHECFAAMEQYRKTFSPLNSNSAFALYFESRVLSLLIDL